MILWRGPYDESPGKSSGFFKANAATVHEAFGLPLQHQGGTWCLCGHIMKIVKDEEDGL
jgi:hypothetical protein